MNPEVSVALLLIINSLQEITLTKRLPLTERSLPTDKRLLKETSPITNKRWLIETSDVKLLEPPVNNTPFI